MERVTGLTGECILKPGVEYRVGSAVMCTLEGNRAKTPEKYVSMNSPIPDAVRLAEVRRELDEYMNPSFPDIHIFKER